MDFLKYVNPEYILIPSGHLNRFSFPHQEVLQRYKEINAKVFNVSAEGAIIVNIDSNKITLYSSRKEHGKYWN